MTAVRGTDNIILATAMELHQERIREAYRRVLRFRSDLEAAQEEHATAVASYEQFKKYAASRTTQEARHDER